MEKVIKNLIEERILKTPLIIEAFRNIKREDFVPEQIKEEAGINAPLPIGYGQTISQPLTVAFMLELIQPQPGDKILDIGAGSGWQAALLAYCVNRPPATKGEIYAMEIIPQIAEFGKKNVSKYGFIKNGVVKFIQADGSRGLKWAAPFDKIITAASARRMPDEWKKQLKIGGRLVAPVRDSIWLIIRNSENEFEEKEFPGFVFVPLVEL